MGKVVQPCRDKSFRKAMSTVMDDLGTKPMIIDNNIKICKTCQLSRLGMPPRETERWGDPSDEVHMMLMDMR